MNNPVDICTLAIIIGTVLVSFKGFRDQQFFDRYKFQVDSILLYREYYRLVTSSFLHGSLLHLFFNMFALYIFSSSVGSAFGPLPFLGIYFGSMIAGGLLALYIRRHNSGYSAIGASGAVSGIVFAYVTLFPQGSIGLFFFPIAIPAWLFGLLYIFGAIYGIKTKLENIGHEAHLGGAIAGIVLSILFRPYLLLENTGTILALLLPISLFLFLIIRWPEYLLVDRFFQYKARTIREDRNRRKKLEENEELDQLLEKISRRGIDSLSQRERARLETLSKRSSS